MWAMFTAPLRTLHCKLVKEPVDIAGNVHQRWCYAFRKNLTAAAILIIGKCINEQWAMSMIRYMTLTNTTFSTWHSRGLTVCTTFLQALHRYHSSMTLLLPLSVCLSVTAAAAAVTYLLPILFCDICADMCWQYSAGTNTPWLLSSADLSAVITWLPLTGQQLATVQTYQNKTVFSWIWQKISWVEIIIFYILKALRHQF